MGMSLEVCISFMTKSHFIVALLSASLHHYIVAVQETFYGIDKKIHILIYKLNASEKMRINV